MTILKKAMKSLHLQPTGVLGILACLCSTNSNIN